MKIEASSIETLSEWVLEEIKSHGDILLNGNLINPESITRNKAVWEGILSAAINEFDRTLTIADIIHIWEQGTADDGAQVVPSTSPPTRATANTRKSARRFSTVDVKPTVHEDCESNSTDILNLLQLINHPANDDSDDNVPTGPPVNSITDTSSKASFGPAIWKAVVCEVLRRATTVLNREIDGARHQPSNAARAAAWFDIQNAVTDTCGQELDKEQLRRIWRRYKKRIAQEVIDRSFEVPGYVDNDAIDKLFENTKADEIVMAEQLVDVNADGNAHIELPTTPRSPHRIEDNRASLSHLPPKRRRTETTQAKIDQLIAAATKFFEHSSMLQLQQIELTQEFVQAINNIQRK